MNRVCGNCVYYPACYHMRSVGANDPCRFNYSLFKAKAKDSLPAGKVLVDVEKLREIEWVIDSEYGFSTCPVCEEVKDQGHTPDCWLGKVLKEADRVA